mmetsp:Transcript_5519/g.8405  ORF Transcript_5519/g.8405 Transcript_5519/m.8405 type:complete len:569 (-) Transcript_5519:112-1818(-)
MTDISQSFICPISLCIMDDPVILGTTGHTYERSQIAQWIQHKCTNPCTGARLKATERTLIPNIALLDAITAYRIAEEQSTHDKSICKDDMPKASAPPPTEEEMYALIHQLYNESRCGKMASWKRLTDLSSRGDMLAKAYVSLLLHKNETSLIKENVSKSHLLAGEILHWASSFTTVSPYVSTVLGLYYYHGVGVSKDLRDAVQALEVGVEGDVITAQCALGCCALLGKGMRPDYTIGARLTRLAADQGFALAQRNLGWCYEFGRGVEKDRAAAMRWYSLAATQGYAPAQYSLGVCYAKGWGGPREPLQAVRFYRMAAEQGEERAVAYLRRKGFLRPVDIDSGDLVAQLFMRCRCGDKDAFTRLSRMPSYLAKAYVSIFLCSSETLFIRRDKSKATALAAEVLPILHLNNSRCPSPHIHCALGYMSFYNLSRENETAHYFTLAARQKFVLAQCALGWCYLNGAAELKKNYKKAFKYLLLAAKQGYAAAQCSVGYCYHTGQGVRCDYAKAARYYGLSADQGYAFSQSNMGIMYERGLGVERDIAKAISFYEAAAAQGEETSQRALSRLGF